MQRKKIIAFSVSIIILCGLGVGISVQAKSEAEQSKQTDSITTAVLTESTTTTETMTETTATTSLTTTMKTKNATTTASTTPTTTTTLTTETTTTTAAIPTLQASNLQVSTISVSCLKATWNSEENRDYTVTCTPLSDDTGYVENISFVFSGNSVCYITGLRENAAYSIAIEPILHDGESANVKIITVYAKTETVEVIEEFEQEDGWTNCFTYEKASGLTANPSYSAIAGAEEDVVTDTGIMRNAYGDYCYAMGTFYGYCGDRLLVTLENGIQFTVKICDSKGDRRYHTYGSSGKSVIEFIVADNSVPSCVSFTGNYGYYNWSGLNLTANIQSIQKINYGDTVTY